MVSRTLGFSSSPSYSLRSVSLSPSIKANNFYSNMDHLMKLHLIVDKNKNNKNKLEEENFFLKPSCSTLNATSQIKKQKNLKKRIFTTKKITSELPKTSKLFLVPRITKTNTGTGTEHKEVLKSHPQREKKMKKTDLILMENMKIIYRNRIRKIRDMTPGNMMRDMKYKLNAENNKINKMFYDFHRQIADNQNFLKIFTTRLISARRNLKY